jgi:hypothetical protein
MKINAIHLSHSHLAAYKFAAAGGKYLRRHLLNTKRRFFNATYNKKNHD